MTTYETAEVSPSDSRNEKAVQMKVRYFISMQSIDLNSRDEINSAYT